jgi:hypothetical protein
LQRREGSTNRKFWLKVKRAFKPRGSTSRTVSYAFITTITQVGK